VKTSDGKSILSSLRTCLYCGTGGIMTPLIASLGFKLIALLLL